jgi:hypothetical protein
VLYVLRVCFCSNVNWHRAQFSEFIVLIPALDISFLLDKDANAVVHMSVCAQ